MLALVDRVARELCTHLTGELPDDTRPACIQHMRTASLPFKEAELNQPA